MDYINNTFKYLEEENKELKDRLKRMTELNQIINKQRESQERDYLQRFHQEEIKVIRQIAENTQKSLKNEIKKLNQQVKELTATIDQELSTIVTLRHEVQNLQDINTRLTDELKDLKSQLSQAQAKVSSDNKEFTLRYEMLQQQYKKRQSQVIQKCMVKMEQRSDQFQQQMKKNTKFINFLQNKLNTLEKQKQALIKQIDELISTLKSEEQRGSHRNKTSHDQLNQLKKQNNNLRVCIKNLEMQLLQLQTFKSQVQQKAKLSQKEVVLLKDKQRELQRSKNKDIEREKSKNKIISNQLLYHKKYLKEQAEKENKKEKDFNKSKKLLINKIKEIENKYQHQKSTRSVFDKTIKKSLQSFQSISLDNSCNKDSPSVSCFLKNQKCQIKSNVLKKQLKIEAKGNMNLLEMKDLGTPCFEQSKQKQIRKTIKIRK